MKKFYSFINPFFDTWCLYSLMVFFILLYFIFLVVKTVFYNMNIIIPIVYIPTFILTFVLPYFIVKNKICRIIAIKQNNDNYNIFYQDGLSLHNLQTNASSPVKLLINIAPYHFRGGMTYIYTSTTIFLPNSQQDEKTLCKKYTNLVIEDDYNNKHLETLISLFKNFKDFSYDIKISTDDNYIEQCEIRKNEINNFIERNQHSSILTKNLRTFSVFGSMFLYLLFGFIVFCSISMLNWL